MDFHQLVHLGGCAILDTMLMKTEFHKTLKFTDEPSGNRFLVKEGLGCVELDFTLKSIIPVVAGN